MSTRQKLAPWAATLAFAVVVLSVRSVAIGLRAVGVVSDQLLRDLVVPAAIAALLLAGLRFWLWWFADHGPGSGLLMWAAGVGLLAEFYPFSMFATVVLRGQGLATLMYGDVLLSLAAMLLLPLGLLRSRLVSPGVFGLGAASTLCLAVRPLLAGGLLLGAGGLGRILWLAFLVALGVSLIRYGKAGDLSLRCSEDAGLRLSN